MSSNIGDVPFGVKGRSDLTVSRVVGVQGSWGPRVLGSRGPVFTACLSLKPTCLC